MIRISANVKARRRFWFSHANLGREHSRWVLMKVKHRCYEIHDGTEARWPIIVVHRCSPEKSGKGAAPALTLSRAAISIIANTCVNLTGFSTELKTLCRDFPHLSRSFTVFLVYSLVEEVEPWSRVFVWNKSFKRHLNRLIGNVTLHSRQSD